MSRLIGLAVFALSTLALAGCGGGEGTVKVSLRDAPIDAEKVTVTISEVSVHYVPDGDDGAAADDEQASNGEETIDKPGWINVLDGPVTYDLLTLKDNPTALGDLSLGEGKITQVRLYVATDPAPSVTIAGVDYPMEVSSDKIKIVGNFDVTADEEVAIDLDFDAAESVVEKGNGDYQLKPTIKLVK